MAETPPLTVYYDGACPLCRREIGFYRRRRGAERLRWLDVSAEGAEAVLPEGLSRRAALGRFHVGLADGRLVSGGAAFAELWAALPGFRAAGRLFRRRPLVNLLELAYRGFLPLRPYLQRLVRQ
ncbi:thiol-disulfide oxidoreductase DCC family protein [Spiribacter halobius]|uniref:DUF393 domain-containing protein n=1 Tax=Sediminicurvatus halobius TaxID=2182432 RepID=A0A2U2N4X3_9GAMM|nr:DUF393 domain-containing protein [Spiribacter halobius]PWG64034.1 DUF393 domain-containing protein [Spiribacter halobius]UEX76912.1 DUF393 domain-containing protein [Spiribacter halobius]